MNKQLDVGIALIMLIISPDVCINPHCALKTLSKSGGPVVAGGGMEYFRRA